MVAIEPIPVSPKLPDLASVNWRDAEIDYDREADTFTLYIFGRQRPSALHHGTDLVDMLVDPTTEEVVGFQIDGYLTHAVYRQPNLLEHADLAGIPIEEIEQIRRRIARTGQDDEQRKLALAASLREAALPTAEDTMHDSGEPVTS